jgi:uncharacterized RDD family membrane protein YckC
MTIAAGESDSMSFDDTKTVVTPEQVSVTYTLAGVGTRFGAILLDTCIQGLVIVAVVLIGSVLGINLAIDNLSWMEQAASWVVALVFLIVFAVIWGYFVLFETYWNGQTPGKRAAGIRVMRDGGYPIDFRAAFVRNVARAVDFLPFLYGVGALAMFLSKESKRLGDYAGGTIVVVDSRAAPPRVAPEPPVPGTAATASTVLGDVSLLNLRALTREQFGVIDRFLSRRVDLSPQVRGEMARKIALPLMPLIGFQLPAADWFPYETFLVELAAAYRRANAD